MKKIISFSVILVLIIAILLPITTADNATFSITILHTNDFHGADMKLLAKRATLIKEIRAKTTHPVLLLDAGDIFTRGPYGERFFGELEFAVMNSLNYDAITLGNNEFKATGDLLAQKYLMDRITQAKFPVLCANVVVEQTGDYLPGVKPYIIKEPEGVKIAIVGVTSPKVIIYPQIAGWRVTDPFSTCITLTKELDGKAEIIIALTHIGYDLDQVLAKSVFNLGAIVGGDSHTILPNPVMVNGEPIVQAGDSGKFLGELELSFEKIDGCWKLIEVKGQLIDLTKRGIIEDPDTVKIIDQYLGGKGQKAA